MGLGLAGCERGAWRWLLFFSASRCLRWLLNFAVDPSCFLRCCHGLMLLCCRFWGFGLWGWVWLVVNVVPGAGCSSSPLPAVSGGSSTSPSTPPASFDAATASCFCAVGSGVSGVGLGLAVCERGAWRWLLFSSASVCLRWLLNCAVDPFPPSSDAARASQRHVRRDVQVRGYSEVHAGSFWSPNGGLSLSLSLSLSQIATLA